MSATALYHPPIAPQPPHRDGILVPRLLGLAGFAAVGKDTAADLLVERCGYTKFSFSDALYREVSEAFGVPVSYLQDRATKEVPAACMAMVRCDDAAFVVLMVAAGIDPDAPQSPRQVLQWWGTEYRRAQDPDYWVKRARDFFNRGKLHSGGGFVNTSTRYLNECHWIRGERGLVFEIQRPGISAVNGHSSDKPLPRELISAVIPNDGTPDDLFWRLMEVFDLWREPALVV